MSIKCCLVGGTGFIGRSIINTLRENQREILVVGREATPKHFLPKDIKYVFGDIKDRSFVDSFLTDIDEIIYLAYSTTPTTSFDNLFFDLTDNLICAVRFFEIVSHHPVKKIIYISSGGAVYGEPTQKILSEDHPTNPITPYGITKLTIEKYAYLLWKTKQLPIVTLRPSNVFGEHQDPFIGQGFISTAIASIIKNKEIIVYGAEGTVRDYLYVDDFCKAIVSALTLAIPGEIYNVGSGLGLTNIDIINKIHKNPLIKNLPYQFKCLPARLSDVSYNVLDATKFKNICKWQPEVGIDEAIQKMTAFFLN
jgi:UDP-glucose 4-epimerase